MMSLPNPPVTPLQSGLQILQSLFPPYLPLYRVPSLLSARIGEFKLDSPSAPVWPLSREHAICLASVSPFTADQILEIFSSFAAPDPDPDSSLEIDSSLKVPKNDLS